MLHLIFYILGIFIIFLIKKKSENKNKGWYMWAVYVTAVVLGSMNYSRFLFGDNKILLWVISSCILIIAALIILKLLVKKYVRTPDHQEDYLFFNLEKHNNLHTKGNKKVSL
jgi:hypothetical protein